MDQSIIFISFILMFTIVFITRDLPRRFFILVAAGVIGYIYYQQKQKTTKKKQTLEAFLDTIEKELGDDHELPTDKVFTMHKTPRNLKFVKRHSEIKQLLFDLKFLQVYDKALYHRIVSYIEYFLKIHFKVMIGKYEVKLYLPMLKDLRLEILNAMKSMVFSTPHVSTIIDIPDLDVYISKKTKIMQAITYKFIKLICHKHHLPFKPPYEDDYVRDDQYALF